MRHRPCPYRGDMHVHAVAYIFITIGAAARLTRLVTRDMITAGLRDAVLYTREQRAALNNGDPLPPPRSQRAANLRLWLHTLVTCDWCTGLWISTLVVLLAVTLGHHPVVLTLGAILAVAHAVGWLAGHE